MPIRQATTLTASEKSLITRLWNKHYPVQLALEHIDDFLSKSKRHSHFIYEHNGETIGWAVIFERDNENWFSIIVSEDAQGKGVGKTLISALKSKSEKLNGWVVDNNDYSTAEGKQYISPLPFYQKQGFSILNASRFPDAKLAAVQIKWEGN